VSELEVFAVATSFACTYLCVAQSRWNYPVGIVSVIALSLLFYQNQLYSSMALNLYLIPTLAWGWFRWRPDADTRPVTFVELRWWPAYVGLAAATWYLLTYMMTEMNAAMPGLDSAILGLSVLAQFLLDQKKIETWAVWVAVNVISIYVYWNAELYVLAVQFAFFLANAFWGFSEWYRTYSVDRWRVSR
jgi:nicotinamide mononucleotide transporter